MKHNIRKIIFYLQKIFELLNCFFYHFMIFIKKNAMMLLSLQLRMMKSIIKAPMYIQKSNLSSFNCKIIQIIQPANNEEVIYVSLEDSIFHHQGGGQPNDEGYFSSSCFKKPVLIKAISVEGKPQKYFVIPKKQVVNSLNTNDILTQQIDPSLRHLHSRIHSAGHLIDLAVLRLGFNWEAKKGYHFIDNPFVDYQIATSLKRQKQHQLKNVFDKQIIKKQIQVKVNQLLIQNIAVQQRVEEKTLVNSAQQKLKQSNSWIRYVKMAQSQCPCGGTHVKQVGQIGHIQIRKIAKKSSNVKVSYTINR